MIDWSWHSILTSSVSTCVSSLGYFLELWYSSSLSNGRFRFTGGLADDTWRVVRRSEIGDDRFVVVCSTVVPDSNGESSELSDSVDWGFVIR